MLIAETELRRENITGQQPEWISQMRQRTHDAASGFQRAAKIAAFARERRRIDTPVGAPSCRWCACMAVTMDQESEK